jgi:hypothetical protein
VFFQKDNRSQLTARAQESQKARRFERDDVQEHDSQSQEPQKVRRLKARRRFVTDDVHEHD